MVHPPELEALIVLGGRIGTDGYPGRVTRLRLLHALQLWREHFPESYLLLTGGRRHGAALTEAKAMARWSLDWVETNWGIEYRERLSPCLLLEEASRNTAASAANTLPLVQSLNLRAVGLITDDLHIHRAGYLFRRLFRGRDITLHPLPFPGLLRDYWRRRRFLRLGKFLLREGGAWLKLLGRRVLRR